MKKLFHFLSLFCLLGILTNSNSYSQVKSVAPDGAVTKDYDLDTPFLPKGYYCGVSWVQALTLNPNDNSDSKVIVDYVVVYKITKSGSYVEIDREDYSDDYEGALSENKGGLYARYPWYGKDYHTDIDASYVKNGFVTFNISERPNNVFHFWGNRFEADPNTDYAVGIRCKIIGKCALSVGFDWWREMDSPYAGFNVNNTQAFCSAWYGDTGGKFVEIIEKIRQ